MDHATGSAHPEATIGIYTDHVLPRVINRTCSARQLDDVRRRVCAGLTGQVVEVGFGSGLNAPFYPSSVTSVDAVEPSDVAWKLASARVSQAPVPIRRSGLDGQRLPFADATFDSALSTWSLCTIPDVHTALLELRRVLAPGARLHVLEHGLAPDESVRRWQRRMDPLQHLVAGGCHLTRDIPALLTAAGFEVEVLDRFYQSGTPKFFAALTLGTARTPHKNGP